MNQTKSYDIQSRWLMPMLIVVSAMTLGIMVLLTAQPAAGQETALDSVMVKAGQSVFRSVCASCHGVNAQGINRLGKPLVGSTFVNELTDAELLAFLQVGRPVTDPLNTTGVMMPARGGRLSLTDDDLLNVIAYIRSLNQ
ncbi:MAG: cytochrome c [Anaerolineae bacterium]|nr:cytochrome c [Anaerolineae bacterium]